MVMLDQQDVEVLSNKELMAVVGGVSVTGPVISAFSDIFKCFLGVGVDVGSSIRRMVEGNLCKY